MSRSEDDDGILTIKEAAIYPKVTERIICRLVAVKKAPAFKIDRCRRFLRPDIDGWIKNQCSFEDSDGEE